MHRTHVVALAALALAACERDAPSLRPVAPTCDARMVALEAHGGAYCIDRHEAVIREGRAVPATDTLPSSGISFFDAEGACRASGYRLCTGDEWTRACAGPDGARHFPYGERWEPHRCNTSDWNDAPDLPLRTSGALEGCVSPEGVFDLSGNVWEWTSERDPSGSLRELRGGGAHNDEEGAECVPDDHLYLAPDRDQGLLGFRCCAPARASHAR